jgi:chemotaxis protein methyltransferase CheR
MDPLNTRRIEEVEIDLLLEGIFRVYGYDFREYARPSLIRRISRCMTEFRVETVSALQDKVLHEREVIERLYQMLVINVTSMFRDPSFYVAFRTEIVPRLRTYPFVRIWHAGCASGEEVYSMAILLQEEGLYERCRIYATDLSPLALTQARSGTFPLKFMKSNTANYLQAGGKDSFSRFYSAEFDTAVFRPELNRHMVFAQHNLVTDGSFNEFNVILCRNVLIYFNKTLQDRVQKLFHESLVMFGILALGRQETLKFSEVEKRYEAVDPEVKIYRKVA